jgi:hypothetical protein
VEGTTWGRVNAAWVSLRAARLSPARSTPRVRSPFPGSAFLAAERTPARPLQCPWVVRSLTTRVSARWRLRFHAIGGCWHGHCGCDGRYVARNRPLNARLARMTPPSSRSYTRKIKAALSTV